MLASLGEFPHSDNPVYQDLGLACYPGGGRFHVLPHACPLNRQQIECEDAARILDRCEGAAIHHAQKGAG